MEINDETYHEQQEKEEICHLFGRGRDRMEGVRVSTSLSYTMYRELDCR